MRSYSARDTPIFMRRKQFTRRVLGFFAMWVSVRRTDIMRVYKRKRLNIGRIMTNCFLPLRHAMEVRRTDIMRVYKAKRLNFGRIMTNCFLSRRHVVEVRRTDILRVFKWERSNFGSIMTNCFLSLRLVGGCWAGRRGGSLN